MQVSTLLDRLDINRESVLVIRDDTMVPATAGSTTTTTSRSGR